MPGIDGFAVCRQIRQHWDATEVPVIMVTGMDDVDSINRAYEVGANDFIAKPINWPILGHRARYVLRSAQAAHNLRTLEAKQAAIVQAMPDMIFMMHRDGTYLDYKDGYGAQPFVAPEAFLGRKMADVLPPAVADVVGRGIAQALARGELQSVLYQLPMADGLHHYEARIAPSGAETAVAIVRDVTAQKLHEEQIRRLAYFDPLTGMPNRLHFLEQVDHELLHARRAQRQLALMFLDLDGFKRINDTLGHGVGDALLQAVAARLKEKVRASDIVARPELEALDLHFARLGGDEFTIVMPDLDDVTTVGLIAQRVLSVLRRPFQVAGHAITVTASLGVAVFPDDGGDAATLLKHADTAMYHAKDEGRNNWQMYSRRLTNKAMTRLTLENDLRRGLEQHEFRLVYQPQVQAQDGRIIGMEALLRWQHPERGLVSPADFIPVAEESGLIVPLGDWVLRTACRQLRTWQHAGVSTPRVAVNLSARQVRSPEFVASVLAILADSGLNADLLELELTESILMDPDAQRIDGLHQLRARGVHFSIDDFGTGYSSMAYVKRFPIGMLKIDQSFIRGLPHSANDAGIVTAILAMARSLQLDVIAEGVETRAQCTFLQQAQCPKLQGYLFSRPVPPDTMQLLLRQTHLPVGNNEAVSA
jgi:diguanylate cyclase (GGDEF)-like protein